MYMSLYLIPYFFEFNLMSLGNLKERFSINRIFLLSDKINNYYVFINIYFHEFKSEHFIFSNSH